MYKRILVPLENGPADKVILTHVTGLAKLLGAEVLLLHVRRWMGRAQHGAAQPARVTGDERGPGYLRADEPGPAAGGCGSGCGAGGM